MSVACADLDGTYEIITAPGDNSDEIVHVWNAAYGNGPTTNFAAFDSSYYNGSISVAS